MRVIRNTGIGGYSGDNTEISVDQQRAWWRKNRHKLHAWLYAHHGTVVGFGMLRQEKRKWTTSVGILPEHQGNGYGGAIVDDLVCQGRELGYSMVAMARLDNPAAVATHHREYWDRLAGDETYAYFVSKP
jgi:GNAT superfamily N-acetyltransferase